MTKRIFVKDDKKVLRAWAFYDWANSVYPLVINTAIFPLFYLELFEIKKIQFIKVFVFNYIDSALIQHVSSFVFLLLALLIPLLSGIADFLGNKKFFMKLFVYLGSFSCMGLYFFDLDNIYLGLLIYSLALFSFWASLVFYNSYLPEIAKPKDQDRASAFGYSLGYIGSVILLLFNLYMLFFAETPEDRIEAFKISFLTVGFWWLIFSQYTFYYLPSLKNKVNKKQLLKKSILFSGFKKLYNVWLLIKNKNNIKKFLIAFFIYSTAVQTIILIAAFFGNKVIDWEKYGENKTLGLIISILIIQLIAVIGSIGGAKLSKKIGNIKTLIIFNIMWFLICVFAYSIQSPLEFYLVAGFVGLVMGGIQSLSRSTYSKLIPETNDTCSFFSFYQMCMIISIIFGTFTSGLIEQLTGNIRYSIFVFAGLFIVGAFLLRGIKMKSI